VAIVVMVCGIAFYGHQLSKSVARTIEENERHLAASLASEQRYRLLFESSPMPTWVCDRQSLAILTVNEAAVQHYGYSREEFLQITLDQIQSTQPEPPPPAGVSGAISPAVEFRISRHRKK